MRINIKSRLFLLVHVSPLSIGSRLAFFYWFPSCLLIGSRLAFLLVPVSCLSKVTNLFFYLCFLFLSNNTYRQAQESYKIVIVFKIKGKLISFSRFLTFICSILNTNPLMMLLYYQNSKVTKTFSSISPLYNGSSISPLPTRE